MSERDAHLFDHEEHDHMNLSDIESALEKGLDFVRQAAPLAAIGGPTAGAIGALIGNVAGTAETIVKAVEADAAIIGSGDPARIRALQAELQAENAKLAAQIDAS